MVDPLHVRRLGCGRDPVRVAPAESRIPCVDQKGLAGGRYEQRGLPSFDVDEVNVQGLGRMGRAGQKQQQGKDQAHKLSIVSYEDYKMKTNATRILDGLGLRYELREYAVDPDDLSAETVAAKIGLPAEQVFKTLLVQGDRGGHYFAVIAGNAELNNKALAKLTGDRRVDLVPLKDVQPLTGYIRGGVTVFGAKREFPVYADETIQLFDIVSVSAGARGTQVLISPADYLTATNATTGDISRIKDGE
jgi:Cys-tRNA(Pro)/Cys-tRNA(Cys) deacylase